MDLCGDLLLFGLGVVLVALVGHGLWALAAVIVHALFGEDRQPPVVRQRCVWCGTMFSGRRRDCPSCGLDAGGTVAKELGELEIAVARIQGLVDAGSLDPGLGEQVYKSLEARQSELLKGVAHQPALVLVPANQDEPIVFQLERLLTACRDPRNLTYDNRKRALAWYRQVAEADVARLSAGSLLALARLLRMAGLSSRALSVYTMLLTSHGGTLEASQGALEAGRYAAHEQRTEAARWFLTKALQELLRPSEYHDATALLQSLGFEEAHERAAAREPKSVLSVAPIVPEEPTLVGIPLAEKPEETETARSQEPLAGAPALPRRSWGQMLGGFMEERNILWGELVGGLLIVGCSIALVISLWRTLEQIPYFPFLVFLGITAALFGAGLYTLSHWKLEATSRGLLVIVTLLTPLDFLVLAGLSRGKEAGPIDWGTEIAALAFFTFLVVRSGKILMGAALSQIAHWLLAVAVVGASASQLLVPRWLDSVQPTPWLFALLSLGPVVLQAAAVGIAAVGLSRRDKLSSHAANVLFLFQGLTLFAVAVALGFIVYWSDEAALRTLRFLAVPIAGAALPLCICGGLVQRKLDDESPEPATGLSPAITKLVGTTLALAGMVIMLAALVLAWPRPLALLVVTAMNATLFFAIALGFRFLIAHVPAMICLGLGMLTAFHWSQGALNVPEAHLGSQWLWLAFSPASGSVLAGLAVLLASSAEWLSRLGRRLDAGYHIVASGIAMLLAMLLVAQDGADVPVRAALVFGIAGVGSLIVNLRWRQAFLTGAGSFACLGSIVHLYLWLNPELDSFRLWLVALLSHASLAVLLALLARGLPRKIFSEPLRDTALVTSFLAIFPLAVNIDWSTLDACCLYSLWLGTIWLVVSWCDVWPVLFAAYQIALAGAMLFGITAWLHGRDWVENDPAMLLHTWSLQTYGIGLGFFTLFWAFIRRSLAKQGRASALLKPGWWTVDWTIVVGLVIWQFLVATAAAWPYVVREFVPARFLDDALLNREVPLLPFSAGSAWVLLFMLATTLLITLWDTRPREAILGLMVLALTVPVLLAIWFGDEEQAAASALRWLLGMCFLACSVMLWARERLLRWANIPWPTTWNIPRACRIMLIVLAVLPILGLTAVAAFFAFQGIEVAGPAARSLFAKLSPNFSLLMPIGMVAIGLAGHAVREKAAGYIFAAGLVVLAMVTGGYALSTETFGIAEGVFDLQLAIITVTLWALAWLWSGRWRNLPLLAIQSHLGFVGNLVILFPALIAILINPGGDWLELVEQAGHLPGWIGLLTTMAGMIWCLRLTSPQRVVHVLASGGVGLCILAACVASGSDPGGGRAYHILTLTGTFLALALLSASWVGASFSALGPLFWSAERRGRAATILKECCPGPVTRRWVEVCTAAVVLLALGGAWGDPDKPYWSSAAVLAVSILFGAMAVWVRRPPYVYVSGLLINLVGFLVWQAWLVERWQMQVWFILGPDLFDRFLLLQVMCLAISSGCWSLVELGLRSREPPVDLRADAIPFAHAAALLAVHLLAILMLVGVVGGLFHLEVYVGGLMTWASVLLTLLALLLCWWDPEAGVWGLPAAPTFGLGLVAIGLALHESSLKPRDVGWWTALLLAAYLLAISLLVRFSARIADLGRRLKMPARAESWFAGWLLPAQALISVLVLCLSLWICLDFPTTWERLAGAITVLFLTVAGALLAALSNRQILGFVTLSLGVLATTLASWALLPGDWPAPWLHRHVLLLAVLVFAAAFYATGFLGRLAPDNLWSVCSRRLGPILASLAVLVLAVVLVQEFLLYDANSRHTPMVLAAVLLVAGLLLGVVIAGLWLAVSRNNPLGLSMRGRVWCVWTAEIVLVLFLTHLRLNVPDLFPGFLGRNWPLVLMALGFLGIGLGELCRRRDLPMLAEPLQRTGLALPLLPILAYLVRPVADFQELTEWIPGLRPILNYLNADRLPHGAGLHALLWFLLGMIYTLVAVLWRSTVFALLAALFANFGLWVIYAHQESLAFLLHPQLWLIPLGVILLAAEHLHRDRLSQAQSQAIRYVGLLVIYLSSTADMFITGLGQSVWLSLVLALLAIVGVLAGILLRVRAFLFQGVAFLFLVIFAQIWHAAVDREQTWVWWASGIVLGAGILTLFALFEKRKNDVLAVIDDIKRWK